MRMKCSRAYKEFSILLVHVSVWWQLLLLHLLLQCHAAWAYAWREISKRSAGRKGSGIEEMVLFSPHFTLLAPLSQVS